jgi:hypothetical protein
MMICWWDFTGFWWDLNGFWWDVTGISWENDRYMIGFSWISWYFMNGIWDWWIEWDWY